MTTDQQPRPVVLVPYDLWQSVLATLDERIEQANYLAPEIYDDEEHKESCERTAETAAAVLRAARDNVHVPDVSPEAEARRMAIIELADTDEDIDIDADATLSEGDDNGCYVSAWVWVCFAGTPYDKEPTDLECSDCSDGSCAWCQEEKRQLTDDTPSAD